MDIKDGSLALQSYSLRAYGIRNKTAYPMQSLV
jgi:hypothetical protein